MAQESKPTELELLIPRRQAMDMQVILVLCLITFIMGMVVGVSLSRPIVH
jgi:hypothetical protein